MYYTLRFDLRFTPALRIKSLYRTKESWEHASRVNVALGT